MICFIATNFNNSEYSRLYIESIEKLGLNRFHIILVDNDSDKEDLESLKKLSDNPNVTVIYNDKNSGYFPGLNIGIDFVRENFTDVSYYVIGNNDIIFDLDFEEQLSSKGRVLSKYPVVSPNISTMDGLHQNPHVIARISKIREVVYDVYHFNYHLAKLIVWLAKVTHRFTDRKDELQYNVGQEIYQGYGACYILTPKFFELFDRLWSPTFLMYEEFFLAKQLEEKGYKTYYEPGIHVLHHCHASTGRLPGKFRWEISKNAHKEYRKYVKIFS